MKLRRAFLLGLAATVGASLVCGAATLSGRPVLLLGATLIDGSGGDPIPDSYVLVRGGRFQEVGSLASRRGKPPAARHARVVDAAGKWIVPGLVDAHVHVDTARDSRAMIRWGVTAARLMEEDSARAVRLAARSRASLRAPDFFPAAPIFTARGGWWSEEPPDSHLDRFPPDPAAARQAVDAARRLGSAEIKIMNDDMGWCRDPLPKLPQIDPAVLSALVEEARRLGLRVSVHAPRLQDARQAVSAGATVLAHGILDEAIDERTVQEMKSRGVYYVPTLDIFDFLAGPREFMARVLADRRIAGSLPRATLAKYRSESYFASYAQRYPNAAFVAAHRKVLDDNLRKLEESGVRVALGTDMWAFPGAGVHLEMEDFVRAGLTPMEALRAATLTSSESIGEEARRGTIEAGKIADFLVLENDPLADITNTRAIESVYKHGRLAWSRYRSSLVE